MFDFFTALILGIVEGVTEFLPISSTGHLIVAEQLLSFKDVHDLFTVVIQSGAIAAVIWYYHLDLWAKTLGLFRREKQALLFWKLLIIATIPAGVVGLLLDSSLSAVATPVVVAISLIIGAAILWVVDNKPVPRRSEQSTITGISLRQAFLVGLGQCFAIVPGVSRSGATIVSGLLTGLNRTTATAFSFYLSIPVLVLASLLKLVKYGGEIHTITGGYGALVVGLVSAFVTALLAVSWLLKYISHHNFRPFAIYRFVAGVAILLLVVAGIL